MALDGLLEARVAVVGHVEWVDIAVVPRLPHPGEILPARESWEEAAGGGAIAAVQMAKLTGGALFFTALAGDVRGSRTAEQLARQGATVHAGSRDGTQRRALVYLDDDGERTITTLGERLVPHGDDPLPWDVLDDVGGVYFTGGDAGALNAARRARRGRRDAARRAGPARLRGDDRRARPLRQGRRRGARPGRARPRAQDDRHDARLARRPLGRRGGQRQLGAAPAAGAARGRLRGRRLVRRRHHDGLAAGMPIADAIALGARCGVANLTGRGPYSGQLDLRPR